MGTEGRAHCTLLWVLRYPQFPCPQGVVMNRTPMIMVGSL